MPRQTVVTLLRQFHETDDSADLYYNSSPAIIAASLGGIRVPTAGHAGSIAPDLCRQDARGPRPLEYWSALVMGRPARHWHWPQLRASRP